MNYDDVYRENPNYFGKPFPELMEWFSGQNTRGRVLDIGCGQGRDAIPLVEMGYAVHAIDTSELAISQLEGKKKAFGRGKSLNRDLSLALTCRVVDLMQVSDLSDYDILLLDGFFRFHDHDRSVDREMMNHLIEKSSVGTVFVFCFAEREDSLACFEKLTSSLRPIQNRQLRYTHRDPVSEWVFETRYRMEVLRK